MAAKKYKTEVLIKSERFKHYQQDFLRALLVKETYTIAEALRIAEAFFNTQKSRR